MNTPDPSSEAARGVRPETRSAPRGKEGEDFQPRYLALPPQRYRGHGRRNLAWGVCLFLLAGLLFAWALILAGPGAAYTVAVALASAGVLHVLARLRLFRQRNGSFLAAALVACLGVFLVLVQQAWLAAVRASLEPPQTTAARATPLPVTTPSGTPNIQALAEAYPTTPAELESGPVARAVRELLVNVQGKPLRVREGDRFPVSGVTGEEVRLAAGMEIVPVPIDAVRIDSPKGFQRRTSPRGETREPREAPADDDPAQVTARAQKEAIRKYPALGVKNSPENQSFLEAYQELKFAGGKTFLEDPEWPLILADQLAIREGWNGMKAPSRPPPREDTREVDEEPAPRRADRDALETSEDRPQIVPDPVRPSGRSASDVLDLPERTNR